MPSTHSSGQDRRLSMKNALRAIMGALIMCCVTASVAAAADVPARAPAKQRVIFQVSDNDPGKWNLALNNISNIQQDLGRENVDIELVAYGPGLPMLKLDSAVASRVADALMQGVK